MSWATRRQFKYLGGLFLIIAIIVFLFLFPVIFKKPTCSDGKQNGTEIGIDCGGSCEAVCQNETSTPTILWSRAFPVTANVYNLVALVENRNVNAALKKVSYEFRAYNSENILIGRREGSTYLPPNQQFAIFEPRFDGAENKVKTVSFEFLPPYNWVKKPPVLQTLPVTVSDIILENYDTAPVLRALVTNDSIYTLPEFDVVAILYDENHNAIGASNTYKDGLTGDSKTSVFFSWMKPFSSKPVTEDVLIQINPFIFN